MSVVEKTEKEKADIHSRKVRKVTELQWTPVKNVPMTMFMMWMIGNEIQIFSIMIVGMAVYQPFAAMAQTNAIFKPFEEEKELQSDVWRAKVIYFVMCLVALAVGLYKLQNMGLLPTAAVDWVDHAPPYYAQTTTGVVF